MIRHTQRHQIAGHYLSALINGDFTGITETEAAEVEQYWKTYPDQTLDVLADYPEFAQCDVSGWVSECYEVEIHYYPTDCTCRKCRR